MFAELIPSHEVGKYGLQVAPAASLGSPTQPAPMVEPWQSTKVTTLGLWR